MKYKSPRRTTIQIMGLEQHVNIQRELATIYLQRYNVTGCSTGVPVHHGGHLSHWLAVALRLIRRVFCLLLVCLPACLLAPLLACLLAHLLDSLLSYCLFASDDGRKWQTRILTHSASTTSFKRSLGFLGAGCWLVVGVVLGFACLACLACLALSCLVFKSLLLELELELNCSTPPPRGILVASEYRDSSGHVDVDCFCPCHGRRCWLGV